MTIRKEISMAKENKIERRLPLTEIQKQIMLTILIRRKSAFLMAKTRLLPEHFNKGEQGYAIIWASVLSHFDEMGRLPHEHELMAEVERRINDEPDALDDAEFAMVDQFIASAYRGVERKLLSDKLAAKFLRMYMEDRLADKTREIFHLSRRNPTNLFHLTSELAEEASNIQAISGTGSQEPFPVGWDTEAAPVEKWDTGCSWFNRFLCGGDSPGEVNGLLGPYGSAKTTTAIQLSVNRAESLYEEWIVNEEGSRGPLPIVYYFFYEGSIQEMRIRALSYAGQIDRGTLETGDWDSLSCDRDSLKPYELRMFKTQLDAGATVSPEKPIPGKPHVWPERQRKRRAEKVLNRNWRPIDMTGNDSANPGRGGGMAPEIVNIIRQDQLYHRSRSIDICCGSVYIDYLLAMARAYIAANGLKSKEELRFIVTEFPFHMKNRVALAFRCPVWILHQLSAESNSLSPAVIPKITDSSEGKGFAEHLDFCFQYGMQTPECLFLVDCGKHRRVPPQAESIIRLEGHIARVVDTDGKWVLDPVGRKIVKKSDLARVHRVDGGKKSKSSAVPENYIGTQQESY